MKVIIKDNTEDIKVTTITLARDVQDPDGYRLKMFHCPTCGNPVIQFKGRVIYMMPGGAPVSMGTVAMCSKCKNRYLFDAIL